MYKRYQLQSDEANCTHLNAGISLSNHHTFHLSTQYNIVVSSTAFEKEAMGNEAFEERSAQSLPLETDKGIHNIA